MSKPKANPTTAPSELKLNVIIVGAGIGGMAAATALGRRGHKVTVFEDAPQIGEVIMHYIVLIYLGWCWNSSIS
jgi:salicylate hydroxylase